MKGLIIAVLIGLTVGYVLMRLSQRRLMPEELLDDGKADTGTAPAPAH